MSGDHDDQDDVENFTHDELKDRYFEMMIDYEEQLEQDKQYEAELESDLCNANVAEQKAQLDLENAMDMLISERQSHKTDTQNADRSKEAMRVKTENLEKEIQKLRGLTRELEGYKDKISRENRIIKAKLYAALEKLENTEEQTEMLMMDLEDAQRNRGNTETLRNKTILEQTNVTLQTELDLVVEKNRTLEETFAAEKQRFSKEVEILKSDLGDLEIKYQQEKERLSEEKKIKSELQKKAQENLKELDQRTQELESLRKSKLEDKKNVHKQKRKIRRKKQAGEIVTPEDQMKLKELTQKAQKSDSTFAHQLDVRRKKREALKSKSFLERNTTVTTMRHNKKTINKEILLYHGRDADARGPMILRTDMKSVEIQGRERGFSFHFKNIFVFQERGKNRPFQEFRITKAFNNFSKVLDELTKILNFHSGTCGRLYFIDTEKKEFKLVNKIRDLDHEKYYVACGTDTSGQPDVSKLHPKIWTPHEIKINEEPPEFQRSLSKEPPVKNDEWANEHGRERNYSFHFKTINVFANNNKNPVPTELMVTKAVNNFNKVLALLSAKQQYTIGPAQKLYQIDAKKNDFVKVKTIRDLVDGGYYVACGAEKLNYRKIPKTALQLARGELGTQNNQLLSLLHVKEHRQKRGSFSSTISASSDQSNWSTKSDVGPRTHRATVSSADREQNRKLTALLQRSETTINLHTGGKSHKKKAKRLRRTSEKPRELSSRNYRNRKGFHTMKAYSPRNRIDTSSLTEHQNSSTLPTCIKQAEDNYIFNMDQNGRDGLFSSMFNSMKKNAFDTDLVIDATTSRDSEGLPSPDTSPVVTFDRKLKQEEIRRREEIRRPKVRKGKGDGVRARSVSPSRHTLSSSPSRHKSSRALERRSTQLAKEMRKERSRRTVVKKKSIKVGHPGGSSIPRNISPMDKSPSRNRKGKKKSKTSKNSDKHKNKVEEPPLSVTIDEGEPTIADRDAFFGNFFGSFK